MCNFGVAENLLVVGIAARITTCGAVQIGPLRPGSLDRRDARFAQIADAIEPAAKFKSVLAARDGQVVEELMRNLQRLDQIIGRRAEIGDVGNIHRQAGARIRAAHILRIAVRVLIAELIQNMPLRLEINWTAPESAASTKSIARCSVLNPSAMLFGDLFRKRL